MEPADGSRAGVLVRRLRPEEWPELRSLRLRALADAPEAFGSTLDDERQRGDTEWQAWASNPDRIVVVAERDGRLVGMASGGRAPVVERAAGLYSMWVEPAARGTGVAEAIVEAVVAWAAALGYPAIGLGVTTGNARAIALYERLGFTDTGERFPLREDTELRIQIMVRTLDDAR